MFQHDCASFSSLGEQDHEGWLGSIGLKQIMHSGNGGLESANVSMEVRSSPGGARVRLREEFPPLACADGSALLVTLGAVGSLRAGLNRAALRPCLGVAGDVESWL